MVGSLSEKLHSLSQQPSWPPAASVARWSNIHNIVASCVMHGCPTAMQCVFPPQLPSTCTVSELIQPASDGWSALVSAVLLRDVVSARRVGTQICRDIRASPDA